MSGPAPTTEHRTAAFRALGDPTRLRVVLLLRTQALTVSELVTVLEAPQSSVSSVLRGLVDAGLVASERDGRHALYAARPSSWLEAALDGVSLSARDLAALESVREARLGGRDADDAGQVYERSELPGRSWRGLAEGLLRVRDLGVVADLGVGSGDLTLLLAQCAARVYAVDWDADRLASLQSRAEQAGLPVTPIEGDLHDFGLPENVDLVTISLSLAAAQHPQAVVRAAVRALRPDGRVWITELAPHEAGWVRERLGHKRLGFSADELAALLSEAGLSDIKTTRVPASRRGPAFETVIAVGTLDLESEE